jgi:hypothetical protein
MISFQGHASFHDNYRMFMHDEMPDLGTSMPREVAA